MQLDIPSHYQLLSTSKQLHSSRRFDIPGAEPEVESGGSLQYDPVLGGDVPVAKVTSGE